MATYLLLDGHSLAFRAYFALQEAGMHTSSGQETQAVYGFVSMTTRLLDDFRPEGLAVCFDRFEPTFRDAIASDYKAGRAETPAPLVVQVELIRKFVEGLGVPAVDFPGYEADDLLGTLARRIAAAGDDVIIVTGDRDTYQLVSDPHVKVLYNRRGVTDYVLYDEAGIEERTGVRPVDYPFLAALRGDASDNLKGVPGVGEKTAARLVRDFGNVDALFSGLSSLTPKLKESLAHAEDQVRQNLKLTPIHCDVPLDLELEQLRLGSPDKGELEQFFSFLEMRTPKERLFQVLDALVAGAPTAPPIEQVTRPLVVYDEVDPAVLLLKAAASAATAGARVVLDAAFAGTPGRSAVEGLAVLIAGAESVGYIAGGLLEEPEILEGLGELVSDAHGRHILAHRAKELMRSLMPLGLEFSGLELDTAVVAYLVDPAQGQQDLEQLAARYGIAYAANAPAPSGQLGFDLDSGTDQLAQVTARRAEVVEAVARMLDPDLDAVGGRELWEDIERPLVHVLAKMEITGIAVDVDKLQAISAELTNEAKSLEEQIYAIAGERFNLNSPPQLRGVLYERLGLKPQKKTKTGYSTDAQTLEKLRDEHPIVEALLRYREVEKLRSTYGTGLLAEVAPDGRIHASFNQTVARTGRLSSDAPNLHNIPVRSEIGRRFREAFIPAPGKGFLVADYNQIELRVIAHLSKDPGLVAAFAEGRDIHAATASGVFGVPPEAVTPSQRARSKMISYGLAYGMEAYGLSQRLSIPVEEAAGILERYFTAFPSVRAYMERTVAEARRRGYTETERGRRRYLAELNSDNYRVRQAAERQAMNAGIQGLAADIFKIALVELDNQLIENHCRSRIVLQVHDEVLVEVEQGEEQAVEELTLSSMRGAYPLDVPLEVNLAWGKSWADAKPG